MIRGSKYLNMKFLFLALLAIPLISTAQKAPAGAFLISGSVKGLADKSRVSVTDINNPTDTLATASVSQGLFELKGTMAEPNLVQLNFDGAQKKSILFIGNEKLSVSGDVASIQDLAVKGSAIHADFITFQQTFNPLFRRLSDSMSKCLLIRQWTGTIQL